MLRKILSNIFAVDRSLQISASRFNHCSTVCGHGKGAFVAWYSGSGECRDDQSVHIVFIDESSEKSDVVRIGDRTGNPVLWTQGNDAILLWSKFEDTGNVQRIVDRWKYCSLWIQRLTYTNEIEMLGDPVKIAESNQHLLGRCGPIQTKSGHLLLPLYDEMKGECVIFAGSKILLPEPSLQLEERSRFGHRMIQPTLWEETVDGQTKLCSLSRNFSRDGKRSFFCESTNDGTTWSEPVPSGLYNRNNSLHVLRWGGENIVLWNDTNSRYRNKMTLGMIGELIPYPGFNIIKAVPVSVVGPQYGAYPFMCVDANGHLNFTFTNANKAIEYHVWNEKFFQQQRRRNPVGS